jgi:N-acetylglucosamine-6-sulfatase
MLIRLKAQGGRSAGVRLAVAALVAIATMCFAAPGVNPAAAQTGEAKKGKGKGKQLSPEQKRRLQRANAKQKRPNVIVVMADDQVDTLLGMGNVQSLIQARGTTFRNSYVSYPLCCPSRATFLTGQLAHNHGVMSNDPPDGGYAALDNTNTLAVWLKAAGYRTALIGKYLNGYGEANPRQIPPGWSNFQALTGVAQQRRYAYKLNENGKVNKYGFGPKNYVTDVLARKARDFVRKSAPSPKPFFLWFTPTAPHGEAGVVSGAARDPQPAVRHFGRFGLATAPRNPNFDEPDVSDKPQAVRDAPRLSSADLADIDRRWPSILESLLAVDEGVARLVSSLRKARDLGKTYIVYTSDNGLLLGAHRLLFKGELYEEALRVPLVIRGPRFPRGAFRDQPVSNVDLAPTILELTGAAPRRLLDGTSLLGPALNPAAGVGRDLLLETDLSAGVLSGQFVYTEYGNGETELYDLANDPFQLRSLHASAGSSGLRANLAARLAQLRGCAGASCR